jgi:hypothetical protein
MPKNKATVRPAPFDAGATEDPDEHVRALTKTAAIPLTEALGLDLNEELLLEVTRKAIEFFEEVYASEFRGEGWQCLGVRRELFRVLGALFEREMHRAYDKDDRQEEERVSRLIQKELSSPRSGFEGCGRERRRLDPSCWSLRVRNEKSYSVMLHLSQLCEIIRLQNKREVDGERTRKAKQLRAVESLKAALGEAVC